MVIKKIGLCILLCITISGIERKRKVADLESPPLTSSPQVLTVCSYAPDRFECKVKNLITTLNFCGHTFSTEKALKEHLIRIHSYNSQKLRAYFQYHRPKG